MNEHGINKKNLLTAFPIALNKDPSSLALADGTAELLSSRLSEIDRLRIYTRIDELPEELLDILAYDFKIDWWDPDYSLEEKRRTFKGNWLVHKKLGTKAAVITALSAVHPNTQLFEWFEYDGGKPYHFKLAIDVTGEIISLDRNERIFRRLAFYKNLRSHCEDITYTVRYPPVSLRAGGTMSAQAKLPLPMLPDDYVMGQTIRAGGQMASVLRQPLREIEDGFSFRQTVRTGGRMASVMKQPLLELPDQFHAKQEAHIGGLFASVVERPVPTVPDALAFAWQSRMGGSLTAVTKQPIPPLQDNIAFRQEARAGGQLAAQQTQPIPELKDALRFKETMRTGGRITASSTIPIPAEKDSDITLSHTGRIGAGGTVSVTVPVPDISQ